MSTIKEHTEAVLDSKSKVASKPATVDNSPISDTRKMISLQLLLHRFIRKQYSTAQEIEGVQNWIFDKLMHMKNSSLTQTRYLFCVIFIHSL